MAESLCLNAIANALGTLMVDYLVQPVERRLRLCYLFRFNKIVEEFKDQKKKLSKEQTQVQEKVEAAKRHIQTQEIEKKVTEWLKNAESASEEAQSLQQGIDKNKRCFCWFPNLIWRYQLSKEIEQKTLAIRELASKSSEFGRFGHPAPSQNLELLNSKGLISSKASISALNEIMKALEALEGDEVSMIGVWGMGGVGKTTLVKEVGNKVKLSHKVIIVVVSQTPDIEKIQNKIMAEFFDDFDQFEKMPKARKATALWARLKKEEKVLIILDDLWNKLNLLEIGIPFDGNCKGCKGKIILTTRRKQVCEDMESPVIVSLGVLDEEEAWTLFEKNASLDNASPDIIGVAKEVAKECGGLPIAIVTLARALGSSNLNGWELARDKLKKSRLVDIKRVPNDVNENAYLCLEMSYEYLQKEPKKCFLLCALYPEDYSIDVEDLVRYAWALRLYQEADSIKEVRSEVFEAIDILKDSCLLLEDDHQKRNIKMHDVVRDVALWIASRQENGLVAKSRVENESSKKKLEILLLDEYDWKTPKEDFEGMPELKVLSIWKKASEWRRDGSVFSFNAIRSLKNLRALHLKGFDMLEGISALAKLTKLEILSLRGSEFREPMDNLGELTKIRVLDMCHCHFLLGVRPSLMKRLVKVEELYLYGSTIKRSVNFWRYLLENFVARNSLPGLASLFLEVSSREFPEGFVFPELERYNILINTDWRTDRNAISSKLLIISKVLPSNLISNLLRNVEFLEVSGIKEKDIKFLTDTTPGNVSVARILQNLKYVTFDDCENLEVIFHMKKVENQASLLSNLKDLVLQSLPNLEYVWKMPTQLISLQSLEAVKIDGCGKLKSLFSFSLAQSLECLEKLEIDSCGELKQIVGESEGDEQEISPVMNPDKSLCLQKLRSLRIEDCGNLEFIFPKFMATEGLPQLQKLSLVRLSQLKEICRPAMQRARNGILLPSLTDLTLRECPALTDAAFQSKPMRASLGGIQVSKLHEGLFVNTKSLHLSKIRDHNLIPEIDGEGLNELTSLDLYFCDSLEYLVDTTEEHVPNSAFSNLVQLSLGRMHGLKTLCNGQFPEGFLQNLKKLTVSVCYQLQEVFQIDEENQAQLQLLSNLEHLELKFLPELRWILKGPAHYVNLQSLKHVSIQSCKKLKSVFSLSLIQSLQQLEELDIGSCDELRTLFTEQESDPESNNYLHSLRLPRLRTLKINVCPRLEYVLPITLAQGLPQLEKLEIDGRRYARWIIEEEIIRQLTIGSYEWDKESISSQLKQVFGVAKQHDGVEHWINLPRLKDLTLHELPNLSSFGPENYFFKAPVLKDVSVRACPQLMKFTIQQEVYCRASLEEVRLSTFKELLRNANKLCLNRIMDLQKNLIPDVDVDLQGLTSLSLSNCEDLECLANTADEEHVPTSEVFTNLVELFIENMNGLKVLRNGQPPRGFLQNLKSLRVGNCKKLEEIFGIDELLCNTEQNQAPLLSNLDSLKIESAPELRWIVKGPSQNVSLRSLKVVSIYRCNKLEFLFSSSLTGSLRLLEELRIVDCVKLETIFTEDETESYTICVPNLETLEITDCPTLKYVAPAIYFIKAPALKELQVTGCPQLSNFSIQQDELLQYSKHFEECTDDANSCNSHLTEGSPNTMNFEQLFHLPGGCYLTSSLETVELVGLNWLRYIWKGPIQVVQFLPKLRFLEIRECENVEQIIVNDATSASSSQGQEEDGTEVKSEKKMLMSPRLEHLHLERLPSLVSFSPVGYHLVFPSLDKLIIQDCCQLITIFTVDSTLPIHAETKAPPLDDASTSKRDICWTRDEDEDEEDEDEEDDDQDKDEDEEDEDQEEDEDEIRRLQ